MKPELKTDSLPVACFAPPLTDEVVAEYEALAESLPDSRGEVRDAMRECLRAVKLWWELPESTAADDAPKLKIRHRGKDVKVREIALTDDLKAKLFDAVPWPYELESMRKLFETVQAEETERNSAKIEQWRTAVTQAVRAQELGDRVYRVHSEDRRVLRSVMSAMSTHGTVSDKYITGVLGAFGETKESLAADAEAMGRATKRLTAIDEGTEAPPIPKPVLESTELRDAAMHLWWFCAELVVDREPLTQDKLSAT